MREKESMGGLWWVYPRYVHEGGGGGEMKRTFFLGFYISLFFPHISFLFPIPLSPKFPISLNPPPNSPSPPYSPKFPPPSPFPLPRFPVIVTGYN